MKFIGLLMINTEDDILEQTLAMHAAIVDWFYVLDGTVPNTDSQITCRSHPKCSGYTVDADLPRPPYTDKPKDGYRQHLYEQAVRDHGVDNWFLLLHGDEVWTFDPRSIVHQHPEAGGFVFPLPCYFPREGQVWLDWLSPIANLTWHLGPGWPEFRMFRGNPGVHYDLHQHFNTRPHGLRNVVGVDRPIKHYPYRHPLVQRARAALHQRTGFDPDNYQHIIHGDKMFWDDEMIDEWRQSDCFKLLGNDAQSPPGGAESPRERQKAAA